MQKLRLFEMRMTPQEQEGSDTTPELPESPTEDQETPEIQSGEERESIETVDRLLDNWMEEYNNEETPDDRKSFLAWRMLKLEQALQTAGLRPDQVKIAEEKAGVLGFYIPSTNEIYMTPYGLGDPEHYAEILVHEASHKEGLADEGAAQLATLRRVENARRSIYKAEQLRIEQTFDVPELLERYSIDQPKTFVEYYLDHEAEDRWKGEWRRRILDEDLPASEHERNKRIAELLKDDLEKMKTVFEEALPELYAECTKGDSSFFDTAVLAVVQDQYKKEATKKQAT